MSDRVYVYRMDTTVRNGDTVTYTVTTNSTATSAGTWLGTIRAEPDMTDWPASDIIDYFAKQLALKRPANGLVA